MLCSPSEASRESCMRIMYALKAALKSCISDNMMHCRRQRRTSQAAAPAHRTRMSATSSGSSMRKELSVSAPRCSCGGVRVPVTCKF